MNGYIWIDGYMERRTDGLMHRCMYGYPVEAARCAVMRCGYYSSDAQGPFDAT